MGSYDQHQLPFSSKLCDTFPISDRYFQSVLSQTFPNRFYFLAGTSYVDTSQNFAETANRLPGQSGAPPSGMAGTSIFDKLDAAGIDWKIYASESSVLPFANEFH